MTAGARRSLAAGSCLFLALVCQVALASPLRQETEFLVGPEANNPVHLAHGYLERETVRLLVDGIPWLQGEDYQVQARSGVLVPLRPWASASARPLLVVRYRFLPVGIPPRLDLRPIAKPPQKNPLTGLYQEAKPSVAESMWQSGTLNVSGSKTVQVNSGNRREMTVDQNLRLTIMGQLTDDIAVRAFLSDDNLPVIPEGNTEELKDIDKVLVQMTASQWSATLGERSIGKCPKRARCV